jgi:hypothetical protein
MMSLEYVESISANKKRLRFAVVTVTCVRGCRLRSVNCFLCGLCTRPLWTRFMGSSKVMLERVSIDDPDALTKATTIKLPLSEEVSNLVETQPREPTGFCG